MRGQRPWVEGSRRILLPSVVAAFLPFALLWLPPDHWRTLPLIGAGSLMTAVGVVALRSSWEGPGWRASGPAYGYLIVVALLRAAGGTSGVSAMMLLPVCWMALYGTRRELWCLLVGVALVFVVPLVLVGGRDYPPSAWRAGILFVTLSAIVGTTVHALVSRARAQELERDRLLRRLDRLAHTDDLTGLPNRRAWQAELDRALTGARSTGEQLSIAMVDIDGFKSVNDRHGHAAGDALLVEVTQRWSAALRPEQLLARLGGDEFALLIPGCVPGKAEPVIARLRAGMPSPHSCSIGVAAWDGSEPAGDLVKRSDQALYDIKRGQPALVAASADVIRDGEPRSGSSRGGIQLAGATSTPFQKAT